MSSESDNAVPVLTPVPSVLPRQFFKIIDKRVYTGSLEYYILWDSNDRLTSAQWIPNEKFQGYLMNPINDQLFNRFKLWYNTRKFGGMPHSDNLDDPILPAIEESNNYYGKIFRFSLNRYQEEEEFYSDVLIRKLKIYGDTIGIFHTAVGFGDKVNHEGQITMDKKLYEFLFWNDVLEYWAFTKLDNPRTYKVVDNIIGSTTWSASEAKELEPILKRKFPGVYPIHPAEALATYHYQRERPLIFLHCEASGYLPNAYSVVVIRWQGIDPALADVFQPFPELKYGLTTQKTHNFTGLFTPSRPIYHFGSFTAYVHSLPLCIQFIARLLDGESPAEAGANENLCEA